MMAWAVVSHFLGMFALWSLVAGLAVAACKGSHRGLGGEAASKGLAALAGLFIVGFGAVLAAHARVGVLGGTAAFQAVRNTFDPRGRATWRARLGQIVDRQGKVLAGYRYRGGKPDRAYPLGPAAAPIVGYSTPQRGSSGLERAFQGDPAGGKQDRLTRLKLWVQRSWEAGSDRPADRVVSLDARLQVEAFRLLSGFSGAIVMLSPQTGEIYAMASTPSFDPNRVAEDAYWRQLIAAKDAPLLNRAIKGLYAPGSSFKIVMADELLRTRKHRWHICGSRGYRPPSVRRYVRDFEATSPGWKGHGNLALGQAFTLSCNAYFSSLPAMLGKKHLRSAARRFLFEQRLRWNSSFPGMDAAMAIEPSRFNDNLTDSGDKTEAGLRLAWIGIGQGRTQVTPLHLALIAAAVANGGVMVKPTLEAGQTAEVLGRVTEAGRARAIGEMMRQVVAGERGTGRAARIPGLELAGKTGTAQTREGGPHAWFIGYAPCENPRLAFAVLVEHGGTGGTVAARLAKEMLLKAKETGYLP